MISSATFDKLTLKDVHYTHTLVCTHAYTHVTFPQQSIIKPSQKMVLKDFRKMIDYSFFYEVFRKAGMNIEEMSSFLVWTAVFKVCI